MTITSNTTKLPQWAIDTKAARRSAMHHEIACMEHDARMSAINNDWETWGQITTALNILIAQFNSN